MNTLKSLVCRMAALAFTGILLCAGSASAQTFESVHGGITCFEAGRSVVPASQGGYLAVGETFSRNADCSEGDIYIRRVSDDGRSLWGMWYDFGGDDYATSVKEVFNSPVGDGFIITGVTQGWNNPCWTDEEREQARALGWYDIFLLRIDYCGNVIWRHTYGMPGSAEVGWDVIETQQNNPGELLIVGTTTYPNNGFWNPRNGYIARVDGGNGFIIWDAYYDLPQQGDDNLYSVDEAQNGDVIAAGSTDSYGNGYQGWLLRVDGNSGQFNTWPHNSTVYGGPDFEEFRSVRELDIQGSTDIVAVGTTHSLTGNDEVYLVETKDDPCDYVGDLVFGNYQNFAPSAGYGVREIPFNGPYYSAGELIVTGSSWNNNTGRQEDVFLQVVTPATIAGNPQLNGPMGHYGGYLTDGGLSVEPVDASDGVGCRSNGFIVTGYTLSPDLIGGDQGQLYLLKTDDHLNANCTDDLYDVPRESTGWSPECEWFDAPEIRAECDWQDIKQGCRPGGCRYCYCSMGIEPCDIDACNDECRAAEDQAEAEGWPCQSQFFYFCDGKAPKSLTGSSTESNATISALGTMPNPVKKGNDLTLNYMLAADAVMTVSVSDMSGREVHSRTVNGTVGAGSLVIGTQGWSTGGYVVSVKIGKSVTTTRMVVTE